MSSRMSPRASHRHHRYAILASTAGFFRIQVQNVSLRNRQVSLKGQKCRGNLPGWRQYGVFSDMRIEKKGDKFSRELESLPEQGQGTIASSQ